MQISIGNDEIRGNIIKFAQFVFSFYLIFFFFRKAFQYVSTAYSNLNRKYIDEILYKPQFDDWKKLIEIAENCNEEIEYLVHKMLGLLPNTYVFTKSMAEHVVNDLLNDKVPAIIIRPSIGTIIKLN